MTCVLSSGTTCTELASVGSLHFTAFQNACFAQKNYKIIIYIDFYIGHHIG